MSPLTPLPRRILVLGRQGSGKGTQCQALARRLAVTHISAGDALRRAVRTGSLLGGAIEETMNRGELVGDELVAAAIWDLISDHGDGFILDGFPRTVEQARILPEMVGPGGIDVAIRIDVSTEAVIERLGQRRACLSCGTDHSATPTDACSRCGGPVTARQDDTPEAIRARLAIYDRHEASLSAWLSSYTRLIPVRGDGAPEDVAGRIWAAVRLTPAAAPLALAAS